MNTLLNLMHQVWNHRTPVRPVSLATSTASARAYNAARGGAVAAPASDLWAWYQSRCAEEDEE